MNINKRLFVALFFSFMGFTIVGTLSHECGHWLVAKYFGYNARINYATTYWETKQPNDVIVPGSEIAITLGGPVQTMLTGSIGLFLLWIFRKVFLSSPKLSVKQWLMIFIALFWLRPVANACTWLGAYVLHGSFPSGGDEIEIAQYFSWPVGSVIGITASIGAVILAVVTFKFIPVQQRVSFIAAGLTGGIAGYVFWLIGVGRYIMP